MQIDIGNVLELKKKHPCGSYLWRVTRTGADIRIKCEGCGHSVLLPRSTIEKRIKNIIRE